MVTQPGPADDGGFRAASRAGQPAPEPRQPPHGTQRWRRAALVILLAVGLCGLAVSAAGVASQVMPRRFTATQQHQIESWDVAGRWRALPEGAIFPATVSYRLAGDYLYSNKSLSLTARRLGVSAPASCASGAGPAAARILGRYRCAALLRATYTDSTGSMVATVGVAVLPDSAAAITAEYRLAGMVQGDSVDGIRPAPVPGTLAASFGDAQRQLTMNTRAGPYVILTTVGYADGRPHVRVAADSYLHNEMSSLVQGLSSAVISVLGKPARTPSCPGAPGC